MRTITSWNDLEPYGIVPLTGEACGLMYRILFDVTARGPEHRREVLRHRRTSTCPSRGTAGQREDPHVGCIMLTHEMLQPLAVFALLENGCKEVYLMGHGVVGIEPGDPADAAETMRRAYNVEYARRLSYGGTAGDRNVHVMSAGSNDRARWFSATRSNEDRPHER